MASCRTEIESKCEDVTSGYTSSQKCSNWPVEKCDVSKQPVTKYTPETECNKVPVELCGPASCPTVPGPEECYEKTVTIEGQRPEEECSLEPQRTCRHVTKLVPQLKPKESCTDVPKEVCTRSRGNPRKVNKPVLKKWCYTPSEEAGLDPPPPPPPTTTTTTESYSNSLPQPVECPYQCQEAVRTGQCDPSCEQYNDICGPCVPTCPARCEAAIQSGVCEPSCFQYADVCGPCIPTCPAKCDVSHTAHIIICKKNENSQLSFFVSFYQHPLSLLCRPLSRQVSVIPPVTPS